MRPTIDNQRYYEERKRERDYRRKLYHVCCECGIKSERRLQKGHPQKEGMVCENCARKLWDNRRGVK